MSVLERLGMNLVCHNRKQGASLIVAAQFQNMTLPPVWSSAVQFREIRKER